MCNIDEIMSMLDWNQPDKVQEKGRDLAKDIKCFHVFLLPGYSQYNKNVWDNCALIIADKTDDELKPYMSELFEWLEDMNWPGASCIWDRLKQYGDKEWLKFHLEECIYKAKALKKSMWLSNLRCFQEEKEILNYKHELFAKRVYDVLVEESVKYDRLINGTAQIFEGMPERKKEMIHLYQTLDEMQKAVFIDIIKHAKICAIYSLFCMLEGNGNQNDKRQFEVEIKINGLDADGELANSFHKIALEKDEVLT